MRILIVLVAVAAVIFLLVRWFLSANPADIARAIRRWGGVGLIILAIPLFLIGQFGFAIPLAIMGIASLLRGGMNMGGGQPSSGNRSQVNAYYVIMELDHDTGRVDGEVRKGQFAGRALSTFSLEELFELRAEVSDDAQSASLIDAFLDHAFPDWQEQAEAGGNSQERAAGGGGGAMTAKEALEILGLDEKATERDIRNAYTRLMKRFHPDQGGSNYFASRINEAKDMLLKKKRT